MFNYHELDKSDYLFNCYIHNHGINLDQEISIIVELLTAVPKLSSLDKNEFCYEKHFEKAKQSYKQGLIRNCCSVDPAFMLDKSFRTILNFYVDTPLSEEQFYTAATLHKIFMGVENKFGEILEEYVASKLKDDGWIWCAGSIVKGIDLIKKDGSSWRLLQIKSRSNTENSSSKVIRKYIKDRTGSEIESWYRLNVNPKNGENPIKWDILERLVGLSFFEHKYSKSKKIYCETSPLIDDLYTQKSSLDSLDRSIKKVLEAIEKRQGKPPRPLTKALKDIATKYDFTNIENIDSLLNSLESKKREIAEEMIVIEHKIQNILR